jgi:hypothetical protein
MGHPGQLVTRPRRAAGHVDPDQPEDTRAGHGVEDDAEDDCEPVSVRLLRTRPLAVGSSGAVDQRVAREEAEAPGEQSETDCAVPGRGVEHLLHELERDGTDQDAGAERIPESFVLGLTVLQAGTVSAAFLVAVFISNVPESIAATSGLLQSGWARARVIGLWVMVMVVSGLCALAGYALLTGRCHTSSRSSSRSPPARS